METIRALSNRGPILNFWRKRGTIPTEVSSPKKHWHVLGAPRLPAKPVEHFLTEKRSIFKRRPTSEIAECLAQLKRHQKAPWHVLLVLLNGLYYVLLILSTTIQAFKRRPQTRFHGILRCLQSTSEDAYIRASCYAERLVGGNGTK